MALCHLAGTSCTDYSAIGLNEREHGWTFVHLLIWIGHRKRLQEPVCVQENVVGFPRDVLTMLLPEYEFVFGVLCPDVLGWPVRRDRQWAVPEA